MRIRSRRRHRRRLHLLSHSARSYVRTCGSLAMMMKQHDNITHALRALWANRGRYALSARAVRAIVHAVTDREDATGSGWNVGMKRQIGTLWVGVERETFPFASGKNAPWQPMMLTARGYDRLQEHALLDAPDLAAYDAGARLKDVERYALTNTEGAHWRALEEHLWRPERTHDERLLEQPDAAETRRR